MKHTEIKIQLEKGPPTQETRSGTYTIPLT